MLVYYFYQVTGITGGATELLGRIPNIIISKVEEIINHKLGLGINKYRVKSKDQASYRIDALLCKKSVRNLS